MQPYTEHFYENQKRGSRQSAKEIVPFVLELVQPKCVIDIGCGVGTWLAVFREYGVEDIVGVDGEYVDRGQLAIPQDRFFPRDLKTPLWMDRQFDLAVSLEVAEHLPNACAEGFVDTLTRLSPVVLFSAAIPFQGGTEHNNEQWPEYWAKLFQAREYAVIDCLRKRVWNNDNVEWWYAQNILLFVQQSYLTSHPMLQRERENTAAQLSLVHPKKYLEVIRLQLAMQDLTALIPPREACILVDQDHFRHVLPTGHRFFPFLEKEGEYWGPPANDATAIHELERLRGAGANFLIFLWPAFWWIDYYREFLSYLRSEFRCVLHNDRLIAFNLRS